jgi:hypothetical protein
MWPDAGDAFDRLVWVLEQRIAEAPPEEKSKLQKVLDAVVGIGRDVGVEVLGAAITGNLPTWLVGAACGARLTTTCRRSSLSALDDP